MSRHSAHAHRRSSTTDENFHEEKIVQLRLAKHASVSPQLKIQQHHPVKDEPGGAEMTPRPQEDIPDPRRVQLGQHQD